MGTPTSRRSSRASTPRGGRRTLYTEAQKQIVAERYPFCVTRQEKLELAEQVGLQSLEQLYNLANRLRVTRTHQERIARDGLERHQPAFDPARLLMREDPATTTFTEEDDAYLRRRFGRVYIEQIAFHLGHTESATLVRARELGLRKFCRYWDAQKVVAWLGRSLAELNARGVQHYPCVDRKGNPAITLISTASLLRWIDDPRFAEDLAQEGRVDRFFHQELTDLRQEILTGTPIFETSRWVSHGHVCLNPWSGVSFGLFDDGSDRKMFGRDLHPADLVNPDQ